MARGAPAWTPAAARHASARVTLIRVNDVERGAGAGAAVAIIAAAGAGERMGGVQKAFMPLLGRPMVFYSLHALESTPGIDAIVLVVPADGLTAAGELVARMALTKVVAVCAGGATRRASVLAGIKAWPHGTLTLVHDGARPCMTPEMVTRGLEAGAATGAAVAAAPLTDTAKEVGPGGLVLHTPDRSRLYAVQTPQVFATAALQQAHADAAPDLLQDDAMLFESLGWPVHVFPGDPANVKVTTQADAVMAAALLRDRGVDAARPGELSEARA